MKDCLNKKQEECSKTSQQKSEKPKSSTEENKKGYKFSQKSLKLLDQCDTKLKYLFLEVIKEIDCSVIEGHRPKHKQDMFYEKGASKLKWPNSKHNLFPSRAVDVIPYPIDWKNIKRFKQLMKVVKKCAKKLDIKIRCGGDWFTFKDYPHYELKGK